jgi:hypothetical protein
LRCSRWREWGFTADSGAVSPSWDLARTGTIFARHEGPRSVVHRLISLRTHRDLVTEIFAVVDEAMHPVPARHRVVRGCDVEVLVAAPLFQEIAQRLHRPGPVEAAGVAQIRILLHDGTGPLYGETWTGDLGPALTRALDALTPRDSARVTA